MPHIRTMTAADLPLGLALRAQAGWNQTPADWQRFLALQPDGCFVAEEDGTPVGTVCSFLFGPVAWVAMVLVDQAHRGRGTGTALVRHALDFLDARDARTVRLDATALGRPVYEKLGFVAEHTLDRYAGTLAPAPPPASAVTSLPAERLADAIALDRRATGADRARLLQSLHGEHPPSFRAAFDGETLAGFATWRPGESAAQVGPCLALSADAGAALLTDAWHRLAGQRVYLDVPRANAPATALARRLGLSVQRSLLRMSRGEPPGERVDLLWTGSGPEKG